MTARIRNPLALDELAARQETARIEARFKAAGGIKAAAPAGAGSERGGSSTEDFHAFLLEELASFLDVPVARTGARPEDVFPKDAAASFGGADLVAYPLDELPAYARAATLVPIFPSRCVLWGGSFSGSPAKPSLADVAGKAIAVPAKGSRGALLGYLARSFALDLRLRPSADPRGAVLRGSADWAALDAEEAFAARAARPDRPAFLPAGPIIMQSWACAREDAELAAFLGAWIRAYRESGRLEAAFRKRFGGDIGAYYEAIGYREPGQYAVPEEDRLAATRLRERGGLRAAVHDAFTVWEEPPGSVPVGFHYELLRQFARDLDVDLRARIVAFPEFFAVGGKIPEGAGIDPDLEYVPDLAKEVDLYVSTLSALPWRRRILDFVPVHPTRTAYVIRAGEDFKDEFWLDGKRLVTVAKTNWDSWLSALAKERGIRYASVLASPSIRSNQDMQALVADGTVDAYASDSHTIFGMLRGQDELSMAPSTAPMEDTCWALPKGSDRLKAALERWLDRIKEDGTFERLWTDFYGVSFVDYLKIVVSSGEP